MIKAILFDAAGTLIHLPRGVGWHYREVAARHGLDLDESRLGAAFARAFRAALPRVAGGISSDDDDRSWWRGVVREVIAECGPLPPGPRFDRLFDELYDHFSHPGVWALYPDALPVLEALHGRYRLGILSNFDRRLHPILHQLGIRPYFDAVVISSEHGLDKPDPRLFAAALAAIGAAPSETIHAGDDPAQDWQAAESAGLHVYRVDRPASSLAALPAYASSL